MRVSLQITLMEVSFVDCFTQYKAGYEDGSRGL